MPIRPFREADAPALAALWERSVRATHFFLTEQDIQALRVEVEAIYLAAMDEIWIAEIWIAEMGVGENRRDEAEEAAGGADSTPGADARSGCRSAGMPAGFLGLRGDKVEMLFVDPARRGQGVGTRLLEHARQRHPTLLVDVNEQNPAAHGFYRHYGFWDVGRSVTDDAGRPFPLIHMRL